MFPCVDLSATVSQTDRRPLQIIWKPGFKAKCPGVSLIRKANVNIVVLFNFGLKSRCITVINFCSQKQ